MERDLSKPFYCQRIEGDVIIIEFNSPNDQIGDFAFEYDFDGSRRKKWEEYIQELERKGIRGNLELKTIRMKYNPDFDGPLNDYPKENYNLGGPDL